MCLQICLLEQEYCPSDWPMSPEREICKSPTKLCLWKQRANVCQQFNTHYSRWLEINEFLLVFWWHSNGTVKGSAVCKHFQLLSALFKVLKTTVKRKDQNLQNPNITQCIDVLLFSAALTGKCDGELNLCSLENRKLRNAGGLQINRSNYIFIFTLCSWICMYACGRMSVNLRICWVLVASGTKDICYGLVLKSLHHRRRPIWISAADAAAAAEIDVSILPLFQNC